MKTYTESFAAYLSQPAAYLPTCWKITRRDNTVVGLTDFDRPLEIAGITYQAIGGFVPSDVDRNLGTTSNQITLQSYFSDTITEADIVRGAYDGAAVFVFRVNPFDLPTDLAATPYQYDPLVSGRLGRFTLTNQTYSVECRGIQQELNTYQGAVTSKTCRNKFGDSVCGLDVANDWTRSETVEQVISPNVIKFVATSENRLYTGGVLTWTTGDNTGSTTQIVAQDGTTLTLFYAPVNPVQVGDVAEITWNCDKTFGTCVQRFGNGTNFQGEPALPGQDKITADGRNQ